MKIAITGSDGKVAQALIGQLDRDFEITRLDLPNHDVSNLDQLITDTRGHDALIHLAWKDLSVDTVDPANGVMYENAYRAAIANDIGLVIMGSSNHARSHEQREPDGMIRYTGSAELANNLYGVEKQKMEAMGRFFASTEGLRVVCARIGNINPEDKPRLDKPPRWMSHRDWGNFVRHALDHSFEPGHFEIAYGVSEQPVFDWVNSFGYVPQDTAEE